MSLRDVERAMIVFEHFYEHVDDFRQADQKQAMPQQLDEVRDILLYQIMKLLFTIAPCILRTFLNISIPAILPQP